VLPAVTLYPLLLGHGPSPPPYVFAKVTLEGSGQVVREVSVRSPVSLGMAPTPGSPASTW
jgi:hypothetical protein